MSHRAAQSGPISLVKVKPIQRVSCCLCGRRIVRRTAVIVRGEPYCPLHWSTADNRLQKEWSRE